ncbi:MAG: restriction endonuclease subunit S [Campylobacterales bacterium]|nr:restriction endonuclease subunit S [Campylobacterales bacterium]
MMSNVPKLRFKEFSGEWEEKTLGYLIKSLDAGVSVNSTDKSAVGNEKAILKTSCVSYGYFDINENKLVFEDNEIQRLKEPVQANTIIMSRMNTPALVGANAFVKSDNNNVYLPDRLWAAKIKPTASPEWTAMLTTSPKVRALLSTRATGTSNSMKNITKGDVLTLPVVVPSKQEQEKIASFLTSVDTKIEQLTKKEELLQQYKKGVMQKIFNQEIRFKADNGREFPEWEEKNGNEIFEPISNKNHNSDLPILAISQEYGAIPREMIDYKISVTDKSIETYKVVEIGDFIISLRSFQGGIEYSNYKGICSPAYIILRPFIDIDSRFYKHYLKTERYIKLLNRNIEGIRDGKMISYKQFSEIQLPYPSKEEQTKVANFLSSIDTKIEQTQNQLKQTKEFKKALLQQMFV